MLKLPEIIMNSTSRHQLNSISLLCEKFWTTNFDEQTLNLTSTDEDENLNENQLNGHNLEQNNNLIEKNNSLNSRKSNQTRSSLDDRNSAEVKELVFSSEDEDHNFIKKEVFNSGSECDLENNTNENENEETGETSVKKHYLLEDNDDEQINDSCEMEERIETQLSELSKLEIKNENKDGQINDLPTRPPRKQHILAQSTNISPPPLPNRNLKPSSKEYFKLNSSLNESNKSEEMSRKKSITSNLNALIDFDVLEQEEKLIQRLKDENCIYNLNQINAHTQKLMSSQITDQLNSDSSMELINSNQDDQSSLGYQNNITKIEINSNTNCILNDDQLESTIKENLKELNLIELKLNESKNDLESNEPLIKQCSPIEQIEIKPLIINQKSSLIQPLQQADKSIDDNKINKELIEKPTIEHKEKSVIINKPETKNCEVQTNAQTILNDITMNFYNRCYKNFLIYDITPNLKLTKNNAELSSMFADSIYSTNEEKESLYYSHFLKRNLSNPSLNQFNSQLNKNNEHRHSNDSIYSKHTYFFERYIVAKNPNVSDVNLQVGDGLIIKQEQQSKRIELINEERTKEHAKDACWQVDSNWEWESSDEEISTVNNNENISTKYRRYSCKYIIESDDDGVESDDGALNENNLQSILNDNVKLEDGDLKLKNLNNNYNINKNEKTNNSPIMVIDSEGPCSSGFWEQNNHKQINHRQSNIIKNKNTQIKSNINQNHKDDETEDDEMVFQEIGLDDIYTTNDELDDNQSVGGLENIYTMTTKNITCSTVAKSISEYIFELYRLNDNLFAKSINNFIQCTKELYENNVLIIMRYIKQFINGIKNLLIKSGGEFLEFVQHERKRLRPCEFLNLDLVIFSCLHKILLKKNKLKEFIYQKFISMDFQFGYNSFMKLNENLSFLRSRLPEEFEIQNNVRLPNKKNMNRIGKFFSKCSLTYSPLKKLEYILSIVSIINYNTKIIDKQKIDNKIDDRTFVSVFIYLVVQFNVNIEIELEYIWSLLNSNLINGDANYYLNVLSSVVYVLKMNWTICQERSKKLNSIQLERSSLTSYLPSINNDLDAKCKLNDCKLSLFQKEINLVLPKIIDHPELNLKNLKSSKRNHTFNQNINELTLVNSNFVNTNVQSYPCELNSQDNSKYVTHILQNNLSIKLSSLFNICCFKILVLDELTGNIEQKIIVCRPEMNAKQFCKIIAQKLSIFNSEDYALFLLTDKGKEFLIDDYENIFAIKINAIKFKINLSFIFKMTNEILFSTKFYDLNQLEFGLI